MWIALAAAALEGRTQETGSRDETLCRLSRHQETLVERGEIVVELRAVDGTHAKEGCALGLVDAPVEAVFDVVGDAEAFEEFMPRVAESSVEIPDPNDPSLYLNRQRLSLPFPLQDRYYTIRVRTRADPSSRTWTVTWTYVQGSGNVDENYGSWTLREYRPGRTLVVYRLFSDPGGYIPKWALNRSTRTILPDVLRAVRRRVAERARD